VVRELRNLPGQVRVVHLVSPPCYHSSPLLLTLTLGAPLERDRARPSGEIPCASSAGRNGRPPPGVGVGRRSQSAAAFLPKKLSADLVPCRVRTEEMVDAVN